jgi:hypothetical protein
MDQTLSLIGIPLVAYQRNDHIASNDHDVCSLHSRRDTDNEESEGSAGALLDKEEQLAQKKLAAQSWRRIFMLVGMNSTPTTHIIISHRW